MLQYGKQIDNQVVMCDQTNFSHPKLVPNSSSSDKSEEGEAEKITEPQYERPTPFPSRLRPKKRSAQVEKARNL